MCHFGVSAKISISRWVAKLNYTLSLSLCVFIDNLVMIPLLCNMVIIGINYITNPELVR